MPYMTPDDLRTRVNVLANVGDFPDEHLEELIEEFEDIAERYIGVAYLPRETTETADLCRSSVFLAKWPQITAVDEITVDTVDVTTEYTFSNGWSIDLGGTYSGVFSITYTHGFTEPTKPILRACREYVRSCALADRSSVPRDAYLQNGDGITFRLSTPDWAAGRPTGYIEVDRILNSVDMYRVPGIA
jgi:hypothetical protein